MVKDTDQAIKENAAINNIQKVQKVIEKKGATMPNMQPVDQSTTTTQQSSSQGNQSDGNSDSSKK